MKKIKCEKCGYEIYDNLKICPFCGNGERSISVLVVLLIIFSILFLVALSTDKGKTDLKIPFNYMPFLKTVYSKDGGVI